MAALGNRTQRILQLESSMGVVECRSTLCKQLFKQGPSMRGCSRHGGSRGCWGGPRAPPSLVPSIPVDVHPPGGSIGNFYDWHCAPALRGEDRNTDADRSRVFWYVTSTPSELRRPSSGMGPAYIRPGWVPYCMRSCPHGLGGVLHANLHVSGRDFDVNR